ncbi:hypothetical protein BH09VER1_BH09VER1_14800 [soil metagenome]
MILAIDSSSAEGSIALVQDGASVREITIASPRGRGGQLFTALEEILKDSPPLDKVVVGTGPGSYNGIRSAIAVAWGISAARKIPVVGISSLLGLAEGTYCAIGDARRNQFYFAVVDSGRFLTEPMLLEAADLQPTLAGYELPILACDAIAAVPSARVQHASAVLLARHATDGFPEPLYLKPPHITVPSR